MIHFVEISEWTGQSEISESQKFSVNFFWLVDSFPALSIHGDKPQQERDWVLSEFKSGKSPIMLATDVASRGIHVDDITCVINYDFSSNGNTLPKTLLDNFSGLSVIVSFSFFGLHIEDYVHRIGRTGRCGKKGVSVSFFTRNDARKAKALIKVLEEAGQATPPELKRYAQTAIQGRGRNRYRNSGFKNNHNNFGGGVGGANGGGGRYNPY